MPTKKVKKKHISEADRLDAATQTATGLPIVGIGASAGGLAAFEAFFSGMPVNTLVQHLAPDHKSILAELIRRFTCMQGLEFGCQSNVWLE